MLHTLFNFLPDVCGVLLATLGLALTVFKEALDRFEKKRWHRGLLAVVFVGVGVLGTISAAQQKRDADRKQAELGKNVHDLSSLVSSYGPKLDELIARSNDPAVKNEATGLRAALGRSVIDFFDVRLPTGNVPSKGGSCVADVGHPYKCLTNKELSSLLLSEAAKLRNLAEPISVKPITTSAQLQFTNSFVSCCMRDLTDFRSAVFDRLGPTTRDEELAWQNIALYQETSTQSLSPVQIVSYTRYLEHWAETLTASDQ